MDARLLFWSWQHWRLHRRELLPPDAMSPSPRRQRGLHVERVTLPYHHYAVSQAVAGDIIHVAAGTYPEVVTVDKSLVFEGANAGVSAGVAPGARSAESVVKGFRSPATNPPFPFPVADQEYSTTIDGSRSTHWATRP